MKHAGEFRTYDITKKEWVLEGDTVRYLNWEDLRRAIDYDLEQERNFSYKGLSSDEIVVHVSKFTSGLWQIHAFGEGNRRTTAVFVILYLRSIGFDVENDLFAKHSWYFRNALVRANYKNVRNGIDYTPIYLERFFRNLLLGEQWDLRNRYLHIHPAAEWCEQPNLISGQAPDKQPDKQPDKSHDKFSTKSQYIRQLVIILGDKEMSVREMLNGLGLKDRESFMDVYLNPSMKGRFVRLLYPNSPRHPRQKYLLTVKGLALYHELKKELS
jgi:hypothetical protein